MENDNVKFKIFTVAVLSAFLVAAVYAIRTGLAVEKKYENDAIMMLYHSSLPMDKQFYEDAFVFAKAEKPAGNVVAGIIPHHLLAADLIARFFAGLGENDYDTVILIGPNHFSAGSADMISSAFAWQTPYGVLECDQEMLGAIRNALPIEVDEGAIGREHAITGEAAFIKRTFPEARFLPLMLKQGVDPGSTALLGETIHRLAKDKKVLVLASVDFSHYKDSPTAQTDDKQSITAIESGDPAAVYQAALDSPASITAAMAYAQSVGAAFELIENSNSALLSNQPELESTTSYITGYFIR